MAKYEKYFKKIQQLSNGRNNYEKVEYCFKLIERIFLNQKYIQLEKFSYYQDLQKFIYLIKNEKDNSLLHDPEMLDYIYRVTEMIIGYLNKFYKNLEVKID